VPSQNHVNSFTILSHESIAFITAIIELSFKLRQHQSSNCLQAISLPMNAIVCSKVVKSYSDAKQMTPAGTPIRPTRSLGCFRLSRRTCCMAR